MKKFLLLFFFGFILIFCFSATPFKELVAEREYRCYAVGVGDPLFSVLGDDVCVNDTYVEGAVSEAVIIPGDSKEAEEIIKNFSAVVLKTEIIAGKVIAYCYTPKLGNVIFVNGLPINLQIIYGGGEVIAASPIFPESF